MKLCWDNIENIIYTKKGNFRDTIKKITYYLKVCEQCGEEFLGRSNLSMYCCKSCSNKNRTISEKTKNKISKSVKKNIKNKRKNLKLTDKSKKYIKKSLNKLNKDNGNWKGGYDKNIPLYNTYSNQIEWAEEVRRNQEDLNILEVKCFKCKEWFIPTRIQISNRLQYLKGNYNDENRLYCSQECKDSCSIFGKTPEQIKREDTIRSGRLPWLKLRREVQQELRKMVIERDGYVCQRCGATKNLQCHHIYPVATNPLESADIDNCVMYCVDCHLKAHEKEGCRYKDLIGNIC